MGVNLGAALAPIVCGTLGQRVGWHYGFAAAGVGMVLGLITFMWGVNKYLPGIGLVPKHDPNNAAAVAAESVESTSISAVPALIGAVLGAAVAFFSNGGYLGLAMGAIIGAALGASIFGSHGEERKRVIALIIVVFFVVFFWMAFEQAGTSMNIFADRHTNLSIGSFEIPSSWFQSINPVFIIVFAPLFAGMWTSLAGKNREPSTPLKMVAGLVLLGVGFLFLVWGGRFVDQGQKVSPFFLTAAYAFHTWGELCLSPVGLSYVTKIAPVRLASLLMGVWFLANAAANKLGGVLAAQTETITSQATFFSIPVATSFGAALLLLLLVPFLKKMTRSVNA
jgi:POT family proton-dependent oligopeptide transporter